MRRTSQMELIRAHPRLTGILAVLVLAVAAGFVSLQVTADRSPRPQPRDVGEESLINLTNSRNRDLDKCTPGASELASCGQAPALRGIDRWLGTPDGGPVDLADLRGKVVLIDFFAYSCINCRRSLPQVRAWAERYRESGLEVIGVHSPEYAFERNVGNVAAAVDEAALRYPVALDSSLATTTEYRNRYRPAMYLIDTEGTVRSIKFGEGGYARTEKQIRTLLERADPQANLPDPTGVRALPGAAEGTTRQIYLSYARGERYRGTPSLRLGRSATYFVSREQPADTYGLDGSLRVERQYIRASGDDSQIVLSYRAAKVFAVLGYGGPATEEDPRAAGGGGASSVRVTSPGRAPRRSNVGTRPRLIELVDESAPRRATVTLTLSKGVRAYALSFG